MPDVKEQEALNQKHLESPEIGDYWHDMFSPALVVVGLGENTVTICDETVAPQKDRWTWDVSKTRVMTRAEFMAYLRYSPGSSVSEKTWAYVVPGAHKWVREHAIRVIFGDAT